MAEDTYQKKIPGNKDFAKMAHLIHQEEMDALSAFKEAEIAVIAGQKVNLVSFKEVDVSEAPGACALVSGGHAGPAGGVKKWSGTMVVSGKTGRVDFYRLPE